MVKVKVIKDFEYKDFGLIKDLKRNSFNNEYGKLYKEDIFECTKEIAEYLMGKNEQGVKVVRVIEVIPDRLSKNK